MPAHLVARRKRFWRMPLILAWFGTVAIMLSGCSSDQHAALEPTAAVTSVAKAAAPPDASPTPPPTPRPTATPSLVPPAPAAADLASGKVLVQAQCAACHALADAGISGAEQPVAPALDGIGAHHTRQWIETELADACAHITSASDPACRQAHGIIAALTTLQRRQVVDYLLSLH